MESIGRVQGILPFEEYVKIRHEVPYVYSVDFRGRTLRYFGSRHVYTPGDPLFDTLREEIENYEPNLVFVEGCHALRRVHDAGDRAAFLDGYVRKSETEAIQQSGEAGCAIFAARHIGADVLCPEPSFKGEVHELLKRGFCKDALFAHYMYRTFPRWLCSGRIPEFREYIARDVKKMVDTGAWEASECELDAVERVSERIWGSGIPFDDERILNFRFWPSYFGGDGVPFTDVNRAAQESVYYRDRAIVSEILWALGQYERVLVVYGCQHAVAQRGALEDLAREYGHDLMSATARWDGMHRQPDKGVSAANL